MVKDLHLLPEKICAIVSELSKKIEFAEVNFKGANGYVLIGQNRILRRKVVVKFYYWGDGAHAEPKLLSDLACENVLKVDDAAAIDREDAYFMTPFCENGDLDGVISEGRFGVIKAIDSILDIAAGASFVHSKGYIHRDLKPSNIFCNDNGRLVIGDFGSVVKKGAAGYAQTGSRHSPLYRTPEEISTGRAYEVGDVYQIGIIFYQLLGGKLPYEEEYWLNSRQARKYNELPHPDNQIYAREVLNDRILKGQIIDTRTLPVWCPKELVSIIRRCCNIDKDKRFIQISDLIAKLNNLRAKLPDWRLEPEPVLYRKKAKFRIIEQRGTIGIEKMTKAGVAWRKDRTLKPTSLAQAVAMAEQL